MFAEVNKPSTTCVSTCWRRALIGYDYHMRDQRSPPHWPARLIPKLFLRFPATRSRGNLGIQRNIIANGLACPRHPGGQGVALGEGAAVTSRTLDAEFVTPLAYGHCQEVKMLAVHRSERPIN